MAVLPRQIPNLNGLKLPPALVEAITQVYQRLYDLRDAQQGATGSGGVFTVLQDIRANRLIHPASGVGLGSLYIETDTGLTYVCRFVNSANTWVYLSGIYPRTQSQLTALGATLTANDTNLLVDVTDFAHILRWNGTVFVFNDPSDPPGRIEGFLVNPSPATGWHLCDGSVVNYLNPSGSTTPVTLPDLTSAGGQASYLKFASTASATLNPAVAPTLTMNSYTPAGTNSVPTFTGSALGTHSHTVTATGTVSAPTFTGNSITFSTTNFSVLGATTAALVSPTSITPSGTNSAPTFTGSGDTTSADSAGTPAGTVSAPTFTGTPATLTGTISTTTEVQNVQLRPYFRV